MHRRRVLLRAGASYALLAAALPVLAVVHRHLTREVGALALLAATALVLLVLRERALGVGRAKLAGKLVAAGPFASLVLARWTRPWQPVMLVRPRPRDRRQV